MKRVAESQLTKDSGEDEDEPQEASTGLQKADPSTLSARRIRGLPKRSLAADASPTSLASPPTGSPNGMSSEVSPEPTSRFGAFTGFGGSGPAPSAFTFTALTSQPKNDPFQASSVPTSVPIQSAPLSQPAKAVSLFPASNPTPPSTPPLAPDYQSRRDVARKYCLSLRGLNSSFLDAVTKAVQADPFVDITEMSEKYKLLRFSAQKEFDASSLVPAPGHGTPAVPPSLPPQSSPLKNAPSMPVPPKSFFKFGVESRATGPPTSQSGGFTPKMDHQPNKSTISPFQWPGQSPTGTSGPPEKSSPLGSSEPVASGNDKSSSGNLPFTFGKPASTTSSTSFGASAFTLGASKLGTSPADSKSSVAAGQMTESKEPSEKATTSFSFKPSVPMPPLTPGFSSFLSPSKSFGITAGTSTPPSTKLGSSNPSPPSPSGFGFGTGKAPGGSNAFGVFGKGSIGNPVGFAFGSPPTTPNVVEPSEPVPVVKSDTTAMGSSVGVAVDEGTLSAPGDTSHDPSPAPSQGSAYDADGPGEEDETTLHETKARAYKIASTGEKKGWVSVGSGQLKLKARVEVARRRLLMRNSSTGQIILNFNLFPGFKVTADKKTISFRVPGEDEAAAVYQLRVPNEAEALKWQETIQKEIDGLAPSADT